MPAQSGLGVRRPQGPNVSHRIHEKHIKQKPGPHARFSWWQGSGAPDRSRPTGAGSGSPACQDDPRPASPGIHPRLCVCLDASGVQVQDGCAAPRSAEFDSSGAELSTAWTWRGCALASTKKAFRSRGTDGVCLRPRAQRNMNRCSSMSSECCRNHCRAYGYSLDGDRSIIARRARSERHASQAQRPAGEE